MGVWVTQVVAIGCAVALRTEYTTDVALLVQCMISQPLETPDKLDARIVWLECLSVPHHAVCDEPFCLDRQLASAADCLAIAARFIVLANQVWEEGEGLFWVDGGAAKTRPRHQCGRICTALTL